MLAMVEGSKIKKELNSHGIWFYDQIPGLPIVGKFPYDGITRHVLEDDCQVIETRITYDPGFDSDIKLITFDPEIWDQI